LLSRNSDGALPSPVPHARRTGSRASASPSSSGAAFRKCDRAGPWHPASHLDRSPLCQGSHRSTAARPPSLLSAARIAVANCPSERLGALCSWISCRERQALPCRSKLTITGAIAATEADDLRALRYAGRSRLRVGQLRHWGVLVECRVPQADRSDSHTGRATVPPIFSNVACTTKYLMTACA
jgi:hypothetical protein